MSDPITFPAQIVKVQTLADGGLRITLDLPETAILAAAHLMECKRQGIPGDVSFVPNLAKPGDDLGELDFTVGSAQTDEGVG